MTVALEGIRIRSGDAVTAKENLVTLLGGIWLTAGLFIDGYAHANIIDTATEDFFTPWHGIFYSGFTFSAAWFAYLMYRRQNANGVRAWIPPGYGWAVIGLGAFAVGGIGDLIWHQTFGVETGTDALLSPTHLLLLLGLILVLAAPFKAVMATGGSTWLAIGSITMLALLASFFTAYARPHSNSWTLGIDYVPGGNGELYAVWTVAGVLLSTAMMAFAALYLIQRFEDLPFGTMTVLWAVPAILEAYSLGNTPGAAAAGGITAGVVADVLLRTVSGPKKGRVAVALSVGVMAGWSAWTLVAALGDSGLVLPAEIWTGQIILAGFVAVAMTMLALPDGAHETNGTRV